MINNNYPGKTQIFRDEQIAEEWRLSFDRIFSTSSFLETFSLFWPNSLCQDSWNFYLLTNFWRRASQPYLDDSPQPIFRRFHLWHFHVPKFRRIKAKSALFCWKTGHSSIPPFMRFFQTAFLQSNPTWSLPQSSLHDTTSLFQDYFNLFWISHFQKFYWCCVFQNCLFALFMVQLDKVQKNFVLSSRASLFEDLDIFVSTYIFASSLSQSIYFALPHHKFLALNFLIWRIIILPQLLW